MKYWGRYVYIAVSYCLIMILCGCTVLPLYGSRAFRNYPCLTLELQRKLASITMDMPKDHFSQILRNHLLFLCHGDFSSKGMRKEKFSYHLFIDVDPFVFSYAHSSYSLSYNNFIERPLLGSGLKLHAFYRLVDKKKKKILDARSVSTLVSFIRELNDYTDLRAVEEAKRRGAIALAEEIYADLLEVFASST